MPTHRINHPTDAAGIELSEIVWAIVRLMPEFRFKYTELNGTEHTSVRYLAKSLKNLKRRKEHPALKPLTAYELVQILRYRRGKSLRVQWTGAQDFEEVPLQETPPVGPIAKERELVKEVLANPSTARLVLSKLDEKVLAAEIVHRCKLGQGHQELAQAGRQISTEHQLYYELGTRNGTVPKGTPPPKPGDEPTGLDERAIVARCSPGMFAEELRRRMQGPELYQLRDNLVAMTRPSDAQIEQALDAATGDQLRRAMIRKGALPSAAECLGARVAAEAGRQVQADRAARHADAERGHRKLVAAGEPTGMGADKLVQDIRALERDQLIAELQDCKTKIDAGKEFLRSLLVENRCAPVVENRVRKLLLTLNTARGETKQLQAALYFEGGVDITATEKAIDDALAKIPGFIKRTTP